MTPQAAVELLREAIFLIVMIVSIGVLPSLIVGLIVSVFQATTQINEQTLSFLPRLLTTLLAVIIGGPWILKQLIEFFNKILNDIPYLIG